MVILSDTRITNLVAKRPLPPGQGRLKVILIDRCTAVGFAGDPIDADRVLESFWRQAPSGREATIDHFHRGHLASDKRVDFLIAFAGEAPSFHVIKEGEVSEPPVGWVGDYDAYTCFGQYLRGEMGTGQPTELREPGLSSIFPEAPAMAAFRELVGDSPVATVGDFATTVSMGMGSRNFHYQESSESYCDRTITISPAGVEPRDYDPVAWGTYFVAVLESASPNKPNTHPHLALHFPTAEFGYYFDDSHGGFPKPVRIDGDQDQFAAECEARFGQRIEARFLPGS